MINISIKNSLLSWIVKKRIYQIDQFILHPKKTQEDVLSSLIYKSKGTFFGIEHSFSKIKTYSDFSKHVTGSPVSLSYTKPLIEPVCAKIEEQKK